MLTLPLVVAQHFAVLYPLSGMYMTFTSNYTNYNLNQLREMRCPTAPRSPAFTRWGITDGGNSSPFSAKEGAGCLLIIWSRIG